MKVELLEEKSKDEIATLWTQHFASKHVVCAVCIFQNSQSEWILVVNGMY